MRGAALKSGEIALISRSFAGETTRITPWDALQTILSAPRSNFKLSDASNISLCRAEGVVAWSVVAHALVRVRRRAVLLTIHYQAIQSTHLALR